MATGERKEKETIGIDINDIIANTIMVELEFDEEQDYNNFEKDPQYKVMLHMQLKKMYPALTRVVMRIHSLQFHTSGLRKGQIDMTSMDWSCVGMDGVNGQPDQKKRWFSYSIG